MRLELNLMTLPFRTAFLMVKDHFSLVLPDLTFIEGVEGDDSILNLLYALVAKGTEHDEKVLSYIIRLVMSQI